MSNNVAAILNPYFVPLDNLSMLLILSKWFTAKLSPCSGTITYDLGNSYNSSYVAKYIIDSMFKKKKVIIPGFKNKLLVVGNKLIPRALSRKIIQMTNKG